MTAKQNKTEGAGSRAKQTPEKMATNPADYRFAIRRPRYVEAAGDWRRNAPSSRLTVGVDGGMVYVHRAQDPCEREGAEPCVWKDPDGEAQRTPEHMLTDDGGARMLIDPAAHQSAEELAALVVALLTATSTKVQTEAQREAGAEKTRKASQKQLRQAHEPGIIGALSVLGSDLMLGAALAHAMPNEATGGKSPIVWTIEQAIGAGLIPSKRLTAACDKAEKTGGIKTHPETGKAIKAACALVRKACEQPAEESETDGAQSAETDAATAAK